MIAIVLAGPSGSGKTAIGKRVAHDLHLSYVSSGEIARRIAQADYFARAGLSRGEMAPEMAMRTEIKMEIEAAVVSTGDFVIDGFPRTVEQLYILESIPGIKPLYFELCVPTLTCFRRLIRRGREDDHPDAVATRWRTYQEQTRPMLDILRGRELNGSLTKEVLTNQIVESYHGANRETERA